MSGAELPPPPVVVIGAGVIGLSAALALQARGLGVLVLDREGPVAGASAGNAGAFAFSEILPLASPKVLARLPRWLSDPLGPLSLPPGYALAAAPWMLRFARASLPARVRRSTEAQTALMKLSRDELEPFLASTGTAGMLRREGNLEVYEGTGERDRARADWAVRERAGIEHRHLDAAQMSEIQPGLHGRFAHGTFVPGWHSISDPHDYGLALAAMFRSRGGRIAIADVRALRPEADGVRIETGEGVRMAAHVVVAAGAFSHRIARTLGERIPLETERGYNTTLAPDAFALRTQITFGGHGFVVSRVASGIRVGGAVEFAGLERPPNFRRAAAMLAKAERFLPGLRTAGGRQWMGFRPSLPDSLPLIGPSGTDRRVVYAFGHGHLGLTQSAGTARLVADLVTGAPPAIDLRPFSPARF